MSFFHFVIPPSRTTLLPSTPEICPSAHRWRLADSPLHTTGCWPHNLRSELCHCLSLIFGGTHRKYTIIIICTGRRLVIKNRWIKCYVTGHFDMYADDMWAFGLVSNSPGKMMIGHLFWEFRYCDNICSEVYMIIALLWFILEYDTHKLKKASEN